MRLIVVRCEVRYTGRLEAWLREAVRLIMIKADGSVQVHADAGGYKPLNWMTPPTVIEERPDQIVVRKRGGAGEDRLEIGNLRSALRSVIRHGTSGRDRWGEQRRGGGPPPGAAGRAT